MFKEEEWKLVQEISSAVYRVSALVKEPSLKKELVSAAIEMVSRNSAEDETLPSFSSIDRLARIISLGKTIGEISQVNSMVLEREISGLKQRIKETVKSPNSFVLSSFRQSVEAIAGVPENVITEAGSSGNQSAEISSNKPGNQETVSGNLLPAGNDQIVTIAERQRKIIDYVRQFPDGCRTKDIYVSFPDVSDRTLRNDIRTLMENMRLERVTGDAGQEKVRILPVPIVRTPAKEIGNPIAPVVTNL